MKKQRRLLNVKFDDKDIPEAFRWMGEDAKAYLESIMTADQFDPNPQVQAYLSGRASLARELLGYTEKKDPPRILRNVEEG